MILNYDSDFQSQPSYGNDAHTHKLKFRGQSVQKKEWKQTDRQTDGQADVTDCFTFQANAVGKNTRQGTNPPSKLIIHVS